MIEISRKKSNIEEALIHCVFLLLVSAASTVVVVDADGELVLKAQDTHREDGKNLSLFFSNAEHFLCYVHFTMDEHIYLLLRSEMYFCFLQYRHHPPHSNSIRTSPLLLKNPSMEKPFVCAHISGKIFIEYSTMCCAGKTT